MPSATAVAILHQRATRRTAGAIERIAKALKLDPPAPARKATSVDQRVANEADRTARFLRAVADKLDPDGATPDDAEQENTMKEQSFPSDQQQEKKAGIVSQVPPDGNAQARARANMASDPVRPEHAVDLAKGDAKADEKVVKSLATGDRSVTKDSLKQEQKVADERAKQAKAVEDAAKGAEGQQPKAQDQKAAEPKKAETPAKK